MMLTNMAGEQLTRKKFVTWALGVGIGLTLGMPDYQSAKETPSTIEIKPAFIDGDQNNPQSLTTILASLDAKGISPKVFITPVHPDDLDSLEKIDKPLAQEYSNALSTLHDTLKEKESVNLMYIRAKQKSSLPYIGIAIAAGIVSAGMIALTSEDDVNPAGCIGATLGNIITTSYSTLKVIEAHNSNRQALAQHVQRPTGADLSPVESFEKPIVYFLTKQDTWNSLQKSSEAIDATNDGASIFLHDAQSSINSDDLESGQLVVGINGLKEK